MSSRRKIRVAPDEAMVVTRTAVKATRLVYVLQANKRQSYAWGKSRIVYIGTTKNGLARVAASVAERADEVLGEHGIRQVSVRIIDCRGIPNVKTWRKLERALLLCFRSKYGEVPWCNTHGKRMAEGDEFDYFVRTRVDAVLAELA